MIPGGQRYEHLKTGNMYEVLFGDARDCTNERDGSAVVVYRDVSGISGKVFVRDRWEFLEKFRPVAD